jgi:hypothetical protein
MKEYDRVRFITEGEADDGTVIPVGTVGVVVDVSPDGYAVDLGNNGEYSNVHAYPEQVELVEVKTEQ